MNLLPEIGAFEVLVIAIVGLLVVGPQDLPQLLRAAGRISGEVRDQLARFRRELMDMVPDSELEEVRSEVDRLRALSATDPFNQATGWGVPAGEPAPQAPPAALPERS